RITRRRLVAKIERKRVASGVIGITLLAAAVAVIPAWDGWWLKPTGLGGVLGDFIAGAISSVMSAPGLPFPRALTGMLCAVLGAFASGWAFQVRPEDMRAAANAAARAAAKAHGASQRALTYVSEKGRRDDEELYRAPIEDRTEQQPTPR